MLHKICNILISMFRLNHLFHKYPTDCHSPWSKNICSVFCNFNGPGGPEGLFPNANCESCGRHETKTDCENDGLPEKGAAECVKVCFNGNWIYLIYLLIITNLQLKSMNKINSLLTSIKSIKLQRRYKM